MSGIDEQVYAIQQELKNLKASQAQAATSIYKHVYEEERTYNMTASDSAIMISVGFGSSDLRVPFAILGVEVLEDSRTVQQYSGKWQHVFRIYAMEQASVGSVGWAIYSSNEDEGVGRVKLKIQVLANTTGTVNIVD